MFYSPGRSFKPILLSLFVILSFSWNDCSAQVTCIASGNFTSPSIWSPAAPVAGQYIIVNSGVTLTIDSITPQTGDLYINGHVIVSSLSTADLIAGGNITVNTGASLENNGRIEFLFLSKTFQLNGTATYIHNPLLSDSVDESIFYNSYETFSTTSNLVILKWNDGSIPLGDQSRVANSSFGNLTLNANVPGGVWDQDGYFAFPAANRVRGRLTISSGTVVMDDGTGNSTQIFLSDVLVNGTGNLIFQRGYDRNLAVTASSFTVNSLSAQPTIMMDSSMGILTFTVTGNFTVNSNFTGIYGSAGQLGGEGRITIGGNFTVTGGNFNFITRVDAPLRVTVSGTTTLNNTTPGGTVSFLDGGNYNLTFTTGSMVISGGMNNYLFGRPSSIYYCKGAGTFTVTNDLTVNGTSSTYIAWSDSNANAVKFNVGRDVLINGTDAFFVVGHTNGQLTFKTSRNYTQTNGKLIAQDYDQNLDVDSVVVGGNFLFNCSNPLDYFKANRGQGTSIIKTTGSFTIQNSGLTTNQGVIGVDSSASNLTFTVSGNFVQNGGRFCGLQNGSGNVTFTTAGILDINAGIFNCTSNTISSVPGTITFTANSIDYDGGFFSAYNACNNTSSTGAFTVTNDCKVNFTSSSDQFFFIGIAKTGFDLNNLLLTLNIGGALTISGSNGTFISSQALGQETISMGSLNIGTGTNSFNTVPGSTLGNGHLVNFTVTGNVLITGGSTFLSASTQAITMTVNGNFSLTGGSVSLKGGDNTGASSLNILGGYTQSTGDFYLHNAPTDELNASATITMTVNSNGDNTGDFSHTGGTFYFDNAATTPAALNLSLVIKSPNYTLGGTGLMTMTGAGSGAVYASISFARNGTILFNRTGSHMIQQALQTIQDNCILDLVSGDLFIASNNSKRPTLPDWFTVMTLGTLNMRTNHLQSNRLNTYSGIMVLGRVKLQHPNGLYNGTVNAAFATTFADSLDYFLSSGSTIEYNGVDNQVISGIGLGKAQFSYHKYFNLAINFSGTPDFEFVYPTNSPNDSAVVVRNSLSLQAGELNLDDDHNPSNGGGRWIVLESQQSTAVSRAAGYIRSESENGNGLVKWVFNSNTSSHVIPFGYNSANYIPFTAAVSSGNAGNFYVGTYHTSSSNTPLPPGISHLTNSLGSDMSLTAVDRFWFVRTTGSPVMNLNFKCAAAEAGNIADFRAIRWIASSSSWTEPPPGAQSTNPLGVQANSLSPVNNWWTAIGTIQFNITASAGSHGSITPSGISNVNSGNNLTYTITADPCYRIGDVLVDGISAGAVGSYTFSNVMMNHTISASFIQLSNVITATSGLHGSLAPAGATSVLCGTNQTFSISPDPCYSIADVIVDGVSQGPLSSYTFVNTTAAHTISASFQQLSYTVSAASGPHGSISPPGNSAVACGTSLTYTLNPDPCYSIANVTVDGVSQGVVSSYTFVNINASHSISVTFSQTSYSISSAALTGGTVSPAGLIPVPCGNSQAFTITPAPCFAVANVVVDGVSQGALTSYSFSNVQSNHSISATFVQLSYALTASAGTNGVISPAGTLNVLCGSNQTCTISPDPCYAISNVVVDGVSLGPLSTYTFTNVNAPHTIHASFSQLNYPITVTSGPYGTLNPSVSTTVPCGQDLTFSVLPDSCSLIQDVTVDGVSQGAISSYTFQNVHSAHSISATFAHLSYAITASSGPNGTISPSGTTNAVCGSDQVYSIIPDPCYVIADVLVDGNSQGPLSSFSFLNVHTAHTISATYVLATFDITSSASPHATISPDGLTTVSCGQDQSFTMTADSCYFISEVVVNGISQGPLSSFTFTEVQRTWDIQVIAEQVTFPLTIAYGPNGQITPSDISNVLCGENLSLSILPDPCYAIEDVVVDGVSQGPLPSYTFTNVTTAHSISATFVQLDYSLTATSGANGTISPAGTLSFLCGSDQTYTISPAPCFAVADVMVDGVSIGPVSSFTFSKISASHTIHASFVQLVYSMVATSGTNGTISPSGITSSLCGTDQTFTIQADPCFAVSDVLVDGVSQGGIGAYTFYNINADHSISASFVQMEYSISATSGPGGTISSPGTTSVLCGTDLHYFITPDSCHSIEDVLVDGVSLGPVASYSFINVTSPHSISVTFSLRTYLVTSSSGMNGRLSPAGNTTVSCGDDLTISITPDPCYEIDDVLVDGISQGNPGVYTFHTVTASHTLSASFIQINYPITATCGLHGTISPSGTMSLPCGTDQVYTFHPDPCYAIEDVQVDGISQGSLSSYTFLNITSVHTIHATFVCLSYSINSSAGPNGSITPVGTSIVPCGNDLTFLITPAQCFQVADVLVDGLSLGPLSSYTFSNINSPHDISAVFAPLQYTILTSVGAGGSISPTGSALVNCGDNQTFTIIPDSGFLIEDVLVDGISMGPLPAYAFTNCTANHSLHATFIPACSSPQILCIPDIASNTSTSSCGIVLTYPDPALSGTSPQLSYLFSGSTSGSGTGSGSGSYFENGTTQVTLTANNSCGTAVCSFNIVITDSVQPVIICLPTVSLTTDPGMCSSSAALGTSIATDNCSITSLLVAPAGPYPVGTTLVNWTATDAAGNSTVCNQAVLVTDGEAPSISCPSTISTYNPSPALGAPVASDNCGSILLSNNAPSIFPFGTTSVLWTATDSQGNSSTCTQAVTVIPLHDTLNLKVFIQGYCNSGLPMNAALYNSGVTLSTSDCDTVQVCLMDVSTLVAVECLDGILNTDGSVSCVFSSAVFGNSYYIRVRHRSAIETWSAVPQIMSSLTSFDFTTSAQQAYGGNMAEVEPGIWAFWSGDIADGATYGTQDGFIGANDTSQLENALNLFNTGYDTGDITGDGIVESSDYSLMENNAGLLILSVHP